MINISELKEATIKFFNDYCKEGIVDSDTVWSYKWEFKGELPNNSAKGCYAHLNGNEVVYIGVAISDSNKGSGLGTRISNYWSYESSNDGLRTYKPTIEGVDSIITLPFSEQNFYLGAALEVYLIQKLNPPKNRTHSRKK